MRDIIKKKGFTLIELMIVVAILGIVVLGLTQIFKTFLDSWWLSRTKLTTQEDAREAAYWIVKEFKGSRRTTLGSVIFNSGFELGTGEDNPYLWDIDYVPSNDAAVRRYSTSEVAATATVRTGEYSLQINDFKSFTSEFTSEKFEVTSGTDYLLSGWFRMEDAEIEYFRLRKDGGGTFLAVSSTGPLQGDWENLTSAGYLDADTYYVEVGYSADSPPDGTIYIDDISLTPLKWEMIDDAGLIKNTTYYYTTQVGAGGQTEGTLHAMVVETMTTSDGDKNRLVRKRLTSGWPSTPIYNNIYSGNWRTIGFNTLADNISYLSFTLGGNSKDTPVNISIKVTGTPTGGKEQEFDVRTQVYPLTE